VTEACGIIGDMPVVNKLFCFRIEPIEAAGPGTNPQYTALIHNHGTGGIVTQAI